LCHSAHCRIDRVTHLIMHEHDGRSI
jgi:hypothetical protein